MQEMRQIPAIVNEKISDLLHDFMNFKALKLLKKFFKKIKKDAGLIPTQENLLVAQYIYARYERNPCNSQ